jgi:hypothetical protein
MLEAETRQESVLLADAGRAADIHPAWRGSDVERPPAVGHDCGTKKLRAPIVALSPAR